MIKASAFKAVESALSARVQDGLSKITSDLYKKIDKALQDDDFIEAQSLLNKLSLSPLADELQDYVRYSTHIAMLFGASRVTQQPGTSVVGLGFESTKVLQMSMSFIQVITQKAEAYIKITGTQRIQSYKEQSEPVQKGAPIGNRNAAKDYVSGSVAANSVSSMKDMEKWRDAIPVKFNPNLDVEARTTTGKHIEVGEKFKALSEEFQKEILTHESAHFSGMDDWHLKNSDNWDLSALSIHENMNGQTTPGELIAEVYARAWHDPEFLLKTAPKLVPYILRAAVGVGAPVPASLLPVKKLDIASADLDVAGKKSIDQSCNYASILGAAKSKKKKVSVWR